MPLKLAIVGRPNVGKSTLFNRLAGKKLAIVDDRPGVTRDRREGSGSLGDLELQLIDTAGFEDVDDESLQARMRSQTERAVDEADVCLFIYDAREGVTPLDRIFAELLRKRDKPVVLGANKSEGKASQAGVGEGHALGLGEPIPISGEHGEGMSDLYEVLLPYSDAFQDELTDEDPGKPVRIAIVGRPNAGKSTLVNRLIGEDRMLVGPEAGITRDAIPVDWTYDGRPVRLVDTAGLRRKARVQEQLEKLSTSDTIRAITFAEVVILVMDAANAFETQDMQIADLCEREGRALVYCRQPRRPAAGQLSPLSDQQPARELRPSGRAHAHQCQVQQEPLRRGRRQARRGHRQRAPQAPRGAQRAACSQEWARTLDTLVSAP